MLYVIIFETALYLSADSLKIDVDLSRFFITFSNICVNYIHFASQSLVKLLL